MSQEKPKKIDVTMRESLYEELKLQCLERFVSIPAQVRYLIKEEEKRRKKRK